ncbi:MAG: transporter, partial [Candidatus Rokuibacteriota bacterium]
MTTRYRLAALIALVILVVPRVGVAAGDGCRSLSVVQERRVPPLAEARTYQPVNGTGGFSVFGANTLPAGVLSVGVGYLGEEAVCQQVDGVFDYHTLFVPIALGVTSRLQVGVDVPYSWYEADRAEAEGSGFDDVNMGVVYRFLDEGPGRPALAIVGFAAAPTAERSEGLGTNEWNLGAKLALSKTLPGGLLGHANVGYTYVGRGAVDQDDELTSGVALEWPLHRMVSVVAEGLASTNRREEPTKESDWVAELRGGFRVRFAGFLLSLAGRKGVTNDAPDWGVFALLTYETPPLFGAVPAGPAAGIPPAPAGPPG